MASASTSNLPELLKILYPRGIAFLKLRKSKLYMQAKKNTKFVGANRQIKLSVGDGTGGSSEFAQALQNRGPSQQVTFTLTRKRDYVIGSIENELIMASKGDEGAVLDAMKLEFDMKGNEMGERIWRRFYGSEGGRLGEVQSISTNTMVLTSSADMRHFRPGKIISLASDNGTGTSPTGGREGSLTVTGVNIGTRTLTFPSNVTTGIPAATVGDSIFNPGDYGTQPSGVFAWTPIVAPSTSYLGVDRSLYPELTGGFRFDGKSGDMIETINNGLAESGEWSVTDTKYGYMNYKDFARLQSTLEGKNNVTREVSGRDVYAEVAWKGLCVYTPHGEVTFVAEPGIPQGYALVTDPEDWTIHSLGEMPHFSEEKFQQESAADARQFRLRCFWNVGNERPFNTTILKW